MHRYNAEQIKGLVRQEGERLADEISMVDHDDDRVDDDDHLIVEMASPVKTLGELLREHWISEGRPPY